MPPTPIPPQRAPARHSARRAWACLGALLLLGCAAPAPQPLPPALQLQAPVVLLGEVHDNAAQHALRLRAFEALLAQGARPALAMEQFDRHRQAAIDELRARQTRPDADAVIAAAQGAKGWQWPLYRPFIELALQHGLPIVAANVPSAEARLIMRDGLAAHGFDAAVPPDMLQTLARAIEDSHCGAIKGETAGRMALSQVARDQFMARVLQAHAARGVVLLAGNGHVRTDVGAPRWLDADTRRRSLAIGMLEEGDAETAYDRIVYTAPQPRPDPCESLRGK
jgi:uncharacterized iron-regulated protein